LRHAMTLSVMLFMRAVVAALSCTRLWCVDVDGFVAVEVGVAVDGVISKWMLQRACWYERKCPPGVAWKHSCHAVLDCKTSGSTSSTTPARLWVLRP
jgi:hypothetical protein